MIGICGDFTRNRTHSQSIMFVYLLFCPIIKIKLKHILLIYFIINFIRLFMHSVFIIFIKIIICFIIVKQYFSFIKYYVNVESHALYAVQSAMCIGKNVTWWSRERFFFFLFFTLIWLTREATKKENPTNYNISETGESNYARCLL